MSDNYVIKVDKLKGYQNTLKGEHTNFTNGVRNPFSRGYFYDCSDSAIVTMRNKIADCMSKIDKGYNNIDSWLDKYMQEFTNVEYSLKNGTVRGIYDHDTNMILSKIANKNYVKIEEAIDVIYSLKVKTNKTERINKYNLDDFKIENFSIDNMIKMVSAVADGDLDIVLESFYGNRVGEYLDISSNLKYYEEYQKTLDSDVKKLEEELNTYIKYQSVDSSSMGIAGGGVGGLINGKTAEIEKGYKEIQATNTLLEEKNKVYEQFNKILEDRASKDESIKKALNNKEATYEDLYKVLEEKAKTDNELNDILTKKKEIDSKFDNLTSIQKKYIIYLSKQSELAAVNKKIIDLRNDMDTLQYRVISDSDEYKEFQKNYSIEDSYKKIVADKAQYQYHENDYDWFAYYETYAKDGLGLKEAGFDGSSLKIGELEAEVDVEVFYKYTTDEEKQMYHFLFNTKGAEAANKYVTSLLNRINEEAGKDLAEQSKKEINYYYSGYADEDWGYRVLSFVASQTKVTEKGIEAGFNQYTRGLESCVVTKKVMTVDEWKEYYESDYIRELGFGYYYDVVTNTSKMLPGMAMGLAGNPVLGSAMYSASIWGSTHDDAIRSGMSEKDAFWYSSLITAEEFATDLLFKATPGLSKVNFDKSFFKRFIKEISGEALQTYYEGIMDCIFKGEEWDLGAVTEESLYSALVAAGSFLLTSGPSAIKSANDVVIKYKMNGQECEIRGKEGLKKVLVEAGIVDNNFDFDSISEFDMNITAADIAAQNGTVSEIKINDMNEVTAEKLSKIKYKERVMFTLPDGRMLSFDELQTELLSNQEKSANVNNETLSTTNLSEEVQEKNINEYDNGTSNIFEDVMKSAQEITDNANQILASNSEAVQNGVRAIKSLSEKFGLNNKSNGQFKANLSKLAKLIISNNVGAIKNPFAKFFNNDNFEIPTEGLPKWHKKVIKEWGFKIDNEIGNELHKIVSDENYVYGVHRTPDLNSANNIYKEGLIMSGDISSGVGNQSIDIENNVTMRPGKDLVWDEAMIFHNIVESSAYKNWNDIGYGMVVKIPKEYVIFDDKGNIKDYKYEELLYEKNGQKYLKPEFIVAQVEVNGIQILPSENTKLKTNTYNEVDTSSYVKNIDSEISKANYHTLSGNFASVDIPSLSDIKYEDLNKLINPDLIRFRTSDGNVYTYKEVLDYKYREINYLNDCRSNIHEMMRQMGYNEQQIAQYISGVDLNNVNECVEQIVSLYNDFKESARISMENRQREIEFNNKVNEYANYLRQANISDDQFNSLISLLNQDNIDVSISGLKESIYELNDFRNDIYQKMKVMGYSNQQISNYLNGLNIFNMHEINSKIDNMYQQYLNDCRSNIHEMMRQMGYNEQQIAQYISGVDMSNVSACVEQINSMYNNYLESVRIAMENRQKEIEFNNKVSEYENYLRWANIPEDQIKDAVSKITPDNIDTNIKAINEQLQHLNDSKYDIYQKMKEMGYTEQQISEYINGLNIFNVFEANNIIKDMYQNYVNSTLNSQNRTIVNKSLKTTIVDFVKKLFGIKNISETKYSSEQYEARKFDATERMKNGQEITQEDIAFITGDPKQYLYLKYNGELDQAGYLDRPGQMDLNEMKKILKDVITNEDNEIINAMISDKDSLYNTTNNLTNEEKYYIQLYTASVGNPISDYLRGIYDTRTKYGKLAYETDINSFIQGQSNYYIALSINDRSYWSKKSYSEIQKELQKKYKSATSATVDDYIRNMDRIIEKSVIKTDTVVYRGNGHGVYVNGNRLDINSLIPGTRFTDSAYISTSLDPNVSYVLRSQVCLEITIPAGTHGAYLQTVSGAQTFNMEEILLGRNTTLEVTGYPEERNGKIYIPVKVVN